MGQDPALDVEIGSVLPEVLGDEFEQFGKSRRGYVGDGSVVAFLPGHRVRGENDQRDRQEKAWDADHDRYGLRYASGGGARHHPPQEQLLARGSGRPGE